MTALASTGPLCLYVRNINNHATEPELLAFFQQYCRPIRATIVRHRTTNFSRGFGFVEVDTEDELQRALKADGVAMQGRVLSVERAKEDSRRDLHRPPSQEPAVAAPPISQPPLRQPRDDRGYWEERDRQRDYARDRTWAQRPGPGYEDDYYYQRRPPPPHLGQPTPPILPPPGPRSYAPPAPPPNAGWDSYAPPPAADYYGGYYYNRPYPDRREPPPAGPPPQRPPEGPLRPSHDPYAFREPARYAPPPRQEGYYEAALPPQDYYAPRGPPAPPAAAQLHLETPVDSRSTPSLSQPTDYRGYAPSAPMATAARAYGGALAPAPALTPAPQTLITPTPVPVPVPVPALAPTLAPAPAQLSRYGDPHYATSLPLPGRTTGPTRGSGGGGSDGPLSAAVAAIDEPYDPAAPSFALSAQTAQAPANTTYSPASRSVMTRSWN